MYIDNGTFEYIPYYSIYSSICVTNNTIQENSFFFDFLAKKAGHLLLAITYTISFTVER